MENVVFQRDADYPQISIEDKEIIIPELNNHQLVWVWPLDFFMEEFPSFIVDDDVISIAYEPERDLFHIWDGNEVKIFQEVTEHPTLKWISDNIDEMRKKGIANAIKYEG